MTDRENVIKELTNLPTTIYGGFYQLRITHDLRDKVIVLLKEQEQKEVKNKSKRIKFLDEYFDGECPSCRSFIDEHSNRNFCGYCGQAVKWNA